eukprot:12864159-Ditylum_brightwellii.AAC.1
MGRGGTLGRRRQSGRGQECKAINSLGYCHSGGVTKGNNMHNSRTCPHPKDGHQIEAAFGNMMGGST